MNPFMVLFDGVVVLLFGGWPGAIVGLFIGWRRRRPVVGGLCGFFGGLLGAIAAFVLWTVIASRIAAQLPSRTTYSEWGTVTVLDVNDVFYLQAALWGAAILASSVLGCVASAIGAKATRGKRQSDPGNES